MSGIAGILWLHGAPAEPGQIEKLTTSMAALGPHGRAHWAGDQIALGHCMLRATPESDRENQPLPCPEMRRVIVWDGRLDNRTELKRDLAKVGARLEDESDASLALQSFLIWGKQCPDRLSGDFAFAVWDASIQELFCARDHMGARPFYYTRNERFFAFASEEEALLSLHGVPRLPNEESIARLLVPEFGSDDSTSTWLAAVRTLLPASIMVVSANGSMRREHYWRLEPGNETLFASDAECEEAFLAIFGEAVRNRMRGDGPVSAMLSGGLDSACIAAMFGRLAANRPGDGPHTYSAISDDADSCIESRCILSLTEDLGDRAHFVHVPSFSGMLGVADLIQAGWSRPHPVDNSILLPALMCMATARDGHRVMLHGMGGDYTMGTPDRYIAYLMRAGRWNSVWMECDAASRNHTYLRGNSPSGLLLRNLWTAYVPPTARRISRRLRAMRAGSPLAGRYVSPEFACKLRLADRMQARNRARPANLPSLQEALIATMQPPYGYMLGLNGYNRVAGRYGVELRDPWSDRHVAEFWLRLPLQYKVRNGWTKYLARAAFASDLKPHLRWRSGKEHLGWLFNRRLMDETATVVAHCLTENADLLCEYVARDALCPECTKHGSIGHRCDWEFTFNLVTLALWLKRILC